MVALFISRKVGPRLLHGHNWSRS